LQRPRRSFFTPPKETIRINEYIRVPEIRVVDADGSPLGIIPVQQALEKARERGLDLVEVSPTAAPPVCRIMDFGKYKYEIQKKQKVSKAKQHIIKIKEIKFHPKTGENDYNYRLVQAKEFLEKGFKVKATVVFRGREMAHIEYGSRWLKKMAEDLAGVGTAESNSVQEGRNVTMIFVQAKGAIKQVPKVKKPDGETAEAKTPKAEKSEKIEKPQAATTAPAATEATETT
jgi:translation initiation factor IF-3